MQRQLPTGTVTFLFTDIEGSTRLLHDLGGQGYAEALAEHRLLLRDAFTRHGGVEVDTQGDAFFMAFAVADEAIAAAVEAQAALRDGPISIRVGIHTGEPILTADGYVGHRCPPRGAHLRRCPRRPDRHLGGDARGHATGENLAGAGRRPGTSSAQGPDRAGAALPAGRQQVPAPALAQRHESARGAKRADGRDAEVADVSSLARDGVRLVTLTGPGGTGKTRLGLQAAAELVPDFPDGVFWVQLAPLRDPRVVIEAAEQALGAKVPLAEHIDERRMLLLFDNFEHVTDAAPDLSEVLAACPN